MTAVAWLLAGLLALLVLFLLWKLWRARQSEADTTARVRQMRQDIETLSVQDQRYQSWLAALHEYSEHGIFLLDDQRHVQWLNQSALAFCAPEVRLPTRLSEILRSYELLELVERVMHADVPQERQYQRDGRTYRAQAGRLPGPPAVTVLALQDVTELQRLGRARRELVANISHDLRTPIAAIQLMLETLHAGAGEDDARRRQLLASIADQTSSLQQLAQEMMDLSLIESGRMPLRLLETPVAEIVDPVVQRLAAQATHKHLRLESHSPDDLSVFADPDSARRVLQNLVHNAIKFTPDGGRIWVEVRAQGEDVLFEVGDTGAGIAKQDLDRIFERFFKADRTRSAGGQASGTGLGLAIARHIVEGHGGRIWAESVEGQGATIYFTLVKA